MSNAVQNNAIVPNVRDFLAMNAMKPAEKTGKRLVVNKATNKLEFEKTGWKWTRNTCNTSAHLTLLQALKAEFKDLPPSILNDFGFDKNLAVVNKKKAQADLTDKVLKKTLDDMDESLCKRNVLEHFLGRKFEVGKRFGKAEKWTKSFTQEDVNKMTSDTSLMEKLELLQNDFNVTCHGLKETMAFRKELVDVVLSHREAKKEARELKRGAMDKLGTLFSCDEILNTVSMDADWEEKVLEYVKSQGLLGTEELDSKCKMFEKMLEDRANRAKDGDPLGVLGKKDSLSADFRKGAIQTDAAQKIREIANEVKGRFLFLGEFKKWVSNKFEVRYGDETDAGYVYLKKALTKEGNGTYVDRLENAEKAILGGALVERDPAGKGRMENHQWRLGMDDDQVNELVKAVGYANGKDWDKLTDKIDGAIERNLGSQKDNLSSLPEGWIGASKEKIRQLVKDAFTCPDLEKRARALLDFEGTVKRCAETVCAMLDGVKGTIESDVRGWLWNFLGKDPKGIQGSAQMQANIVARFLDDVSDPRNGDMLKPGDVLDESKVGQCVKDWLKRRVSDEVKGLSDVLKDVDKAGKYSTVSDVGKLVIELLAGKNPNELISQGAILPIGFESDARKKLEAVLMDYKLGLVNRIFVGGLKNFNPVNRVAECLDLLSKAFVEYYVDSIDPGKRLKVLQNKDLEGKVKEEEKRRTFDFLERAAGKMKAVGKESDSRHTFELAKKWIGEPYLNFFTNTLGRPTLGSNPAESCNKLKEIKGLSQEGKRSQNLAYLFSLANNAVGGYEFTANDARDSEKLLTAIHFMHQAVKGAVLKNVEKYKDPDRAKLAKQIGEEDFWGIVEKSQKFKDQLKVLESDKGGLRHACDQLADQTYVTDTLLPILRADIDRAFEERVNQELVKIEKEKVEAQKTAQKAQTSAYRTYVIDAVDAWFGNGKNNGSLLFYVMKEPLLKWLGEQKNAFFSFVQSQTATSPEALAKKLTGNILDNFFAIIEKRLADEGFTLYEFSSDKKLCEKVGKALGEYLAQVSVQNLLLNQLRIEKSVADCLYAGDVLDRMLVFRMEKAVSVVMGPGVEQDPQKVERKRRLEESQATEDVVRMMKQLKAWREEKLSIGEIRRLLDDEYAKLLLKNSERLGKLSGSKVVEPKKAVVTEKKQTFSLSGLTSLFSWKSKE